MLYKWLRYNLCEGIFIILYMDCWKQKKKHNKLDTKQKTKHNINHVTKNEWSTSMNDKWVLGEV